MKFMNSLTKYCYDNGNGVSSFNIKQNQHQQLHRQMRWACVQVNQQQQFARECDRQVIECTNNNVVATEYSRKREHEHSGSRTFIRLFV